MFQFRPHSLLAICHRLNAVNSKEKLCCRHSNQRPSGYKPDSQENIDQKKDPQMKQALLIGVFTAIVTGSAIGLQSSLGSRIGSAITPLRTGLWMNFVGGTIAGLLILLLRNQQQVGGRLPAAVGPMLVVAGALGVAIITGVSFSLARTGVAAGLAGLFLGQMLVGLIVDTLGWGSIQAVPLDWRRVLGLALMALAVYLMLPKE